MDTAEALQTATVERPTMRGVMHAFAAVGAIAGTVWLLLIAGSPSGYVGAAIFGTSLMVLYTTSATYHQVRWPEQWRHIPKRLDHAAIFVLIAGTYTPFCLDVSLAWGIPLLAVVWTLGGLGAIVKLVWPYAPRWLGVSLYLGLGWIGVVGTPEVISHYALSPIALLIAGGAMYTVGGFVYGLQRPNPWPKVFGFHEVFHTLVVAGSAFHFAAVAIYVV